MSLERILATLTNPDQPLKAITAKVDKEDTVIGTLGPLTSRLMSTFLTLKEDFDECVAKFGDLCVCYLGSVKENGPEQADKEYLPKLTEKFKLLKDPLVSLCHLEAFLCREIKSEYQEALDKAGMPIIGFREGYQVVCRKHDTRKDGESVSADLRKHFISIGWIKESTSVEFVIHIPSLNKDEETGTEAS